MLLVELAYKIIYNIVSGEQQKRWQINVACPKYNCFSGTTIPLNQKKSLYPYLHLPRQERDNASVDCFAPSHSCYMLTCTKHKAQWVKAIRYKLLIYAYYLQQAK